MNDFAACILDRNLRSALGLVGLLTFSAPGAWANEAPAPAPDKNVLVDVPFDFSSGVIILAVDFGGGRARKIMFDTGNSASILDPAVAKELGFSPPAPAGPKSPTPSMNLPVKVGDSSLGDVKIYVAAFSEQVAKDYGIHADGTLGYGFFQQRIVQIDYAACRFRLLQHAPDAASLSDASAITWRKYWSQSPNLVTLEDLTIAGHRICAQIDTFLAQTAIVFSPKLPWLKDEPLPAVVPINYEDAKLGAVRIPGGLALGHCSIDGSTPVFLAGADAHVPETEIAAVIGNGFFRESVVTFDFPASRFLVSAVHS